MSCHFDTEESGGKLRKNKTAIVKAGAVQSIKELVLEVR